MRKVFKHVSCTDDQLVLYFRDGNAARASMKEVGQRSWEYQFEFAVEMSKRCQQVMGKDPDMIEAYEVFEQWYYPSVTCTNMKGSKIIFIRKGGDSRYFPIQFSWRICILAHNVTSSLKKHSNLRWHTVLHRRTRNRSTIFLWINPIHLVLTFFRNDRRLWRSWFQEDLMMWSCMTGIVIFRDG